MFTHHACTITSIAYRVSMSCKHYTISCASHDHVVCASNALHDMVMCFTRYGHLLFHTTCSHDMVGQCYTRHPFMYTRHAPTAWYTRHGHHTTWSRREMYTRHAHTTWSCTTRQVPHDMVNVTHDMVHTLDTPTTWLKVHTTWSAPHDMITR